MTFDMFEAASMETAGLDLKARMASLREGFKSSLKPEYNAYMDMPESIDGNISRWLEVDAIDRAAEIAALRPAVIDTVKQMYKGIDFDDYHTLGLEKINTWKRSNEYFNINLKQQSGFAAEVIGTAKENLAAKLKGSDITTYRADDRPDLFPRNDQYVDKIRVNSAGEIVERVQVKFVGDNADKCLKKLMREKFDKYYYDGKVDKMEVPKDFYDGIKNKIPGELENLEKKLQKVKELGKEDVAQKIEKKIDRLNKIDQMLEKSTVTSQEAWDGVIHPKRCVARLFATDTFAEGNKAGLESAAIAATITVAVSTVDNVSKYIDGEITAQEAFLDVAKDTGAAGGIAYGTAFVSTAVAQTMSSSSQQLIQSLGKSGVPGAVISFGVQSFDSVADYASGVIDEKQLVYDLGESAVQVGGSIAGSAAAGAALGSVVPGAGTAVGFGVGLVGGMVGCAIASEAYASAVQFGSENTGVLADKAQQMATRTVDIAKEVVPDKVENIVASLNDYASINNLPFRV